MARWMLACMRVQEQVPLAGPLHAEPFASSKACALLKRLLLLVQGMTRRRCARMLGATDTSHQSRPLSKTLADAIMFIPLMKARRSYLLLIHLLLHT